MIQCVNAAVLQGIDGVLIKVECDVSEGLPCFEMVGYLSGEVKEASKRIKAALKNAGLRLPAKKIIVNLSPANIRKTGTGFDLPVLLGIAAAYGFVNGERFKDMLVLGEVSLTGQILPVHGVLPIVSMAKKEGFSLCIVPKENEEEARLQPGIRVLGAERIQDLFQVLNSNSVEEVIHQQEVSKHQKCHFFKERTEGDFLEVRGHALAKRAILIAASGMHNLLFVGTPGSGKTMLAERIPSILPDMTKEEEMEVTKIYSVCGQMQGRKGLISKRPFRSPHHSVTMQGLIGGGVPVRPGEVSLANKGVLFLDELAEFQSRTLEAMRQPIEEGQVHISRSRGTYTFPADFMLVGAMNPCPCGYFPDFSRCHCTQTAIQNYLGRVSGPLLDRMDLCVEVSEVKYGEATSQAKGMSSEEMKTMVTQAHLIQQKRFLGEGILFNGQMSVAQTERFCALDKSLETWMGEMYEKNNMSMRGYHRTLKVARTIADLERREDICRTDLEEAILFRNIDGKYWNR